MKLFYVLAEIHKSVTEKVAAWVLESEPKFIGETLLRCICDDMRYAWSRAADSLTVVKHVEAEFPRLPWSSDWQIQSPRVLTWDFLSNNFDEDEWGVAMENLRRMEEAASGNAVRSNRRLE